MHLISRGAAFVISTSKLQSVPLLLLEFQPLSTAIVLLSMIQLQTTFCTGNKELDAQILYRYLVPDRLPIFHLCHNPDRSYRLLSSQIPSYIAVQDDVGKYRCVSPSQLDGELCFELEYTDLETGKEGCCPERIPFSFDHRYPRKVNVARKDSSFLGRCCQGR